MTSIYRNSSAGDGAGSGDGAGTGDGLFVQEEAIRARLDDQELNLGAAAAIQNIYRAAAVVRQHAERELLSEHGLTWGGFTVLWVLWVLGSMESSSLAAECGVAKGTVTGLVATLEKRDLASRHRLTADRRRVEVRLTAQGERLIADLYPRFNTLEVALVAGLDEQSQQDLARALRQVIVNAEA